MSLFAPFGDTTNCPHLRVEATSLVFKSAPVSLNKPGDVAQLMIPSLCAACHSTSSPQRSGLLGVFGFKQPGIFPSCPLQERWLCSCSGRDERSARRYVRNKDEWGCWVCRDILGLIQRIKVQMSASVFLSYCDTSTSQPCRCNYLCTIESCYVVLSCGYVYPRGEVDDEEPSGCGAAWTVSLAQ